MSAVGSVPSLGKPINATPVARPLSSPASEHVPPLSGNGNGLALASQGPADLFDAATTPSAASSKRAVASADTGEKMSLKARMSFWAQKVWIGLCTKLFGRR